jgi:hypothetical protein
MRLTGHVASLEDRRDAYVVVLGNSDGNSPLGRPKLKWENIRMHLKEIVCNAWNWIYLA